MQQRATVHTATVGVATGQVAEIYHPGYAAKRMEIGALIAAAPRQNVVRARPQTGDIVILLGGRTGRDGCGGAVGSSKAHDEESLISCGAEVQKGDPLTERNILRLFRKPEVAGMIKKCNDFGAGGVSVAIGERLPAWILIWMQYPEMKVLTEQNWPFPSRRSGWQWFWHRKMKSFHPGRPGGKPGSDCGCPGNGYPSYENEMAGQVYS